jgi:hypothetical protein
LWRSACRRCFGSFRFDDVWWSVLSYPAVGWCILMSVQPLPWPEPTPEVRGCGGLRAAGAAV